MHNLGTVIKFELIRTLKKPTFWIGVLSIPILFIAIGALGYFSEQQAMSQYEEMASDTINFKITDKSGIISPVIIEASGGSLAPESEKQSSIDNVRKGELEAYYFVPENLAESVVEIHGVNTDSTQNGKYRSILQAMLTNSSIETVDPNKIIALNSAYAAESTLYKDGEVYDPASSMIAPGIFLVVFYLVIVLLSNQMLTSTTEEKENRVTEMILTSIKSKTLIIGKIISLIILGLIQILILFIPVIVGFFVAQNYLEIPDISPLIASIKWDFWPIFTGALILIAGFMMFTGLLVGISAAVPTTKDANNFFSVVLILLMAPFFVMTAFMSSEPGLVVQILSFFPLTSPISLLLRNTLGTLSVMDGIIGVGILTITSIIAITVAIRVFRYGTISYGSRVSLRQIFPKK